MRHEIQLNDARPLDIIIRSFVGLRNLFKQCWRFDAGDDEIPKLSTLAIKGPGVPAQAGIYQSKGHNDPFGLSAAHRVVADGDGALGVDGSTNHGQHIHLGYAQGCGGFTG
ncbi:hypothetical protein SDC9_203176 [bioreactor metagenome]|uniref:Uncharacterized protein n=1 Tax=bioreactor metagenome TaxID=1076179 RepID=A0A645J7M7_9ZZZZ